MYKFIRILLLSLFCTSLAYGFPSQVIIVRHADKLAQSDPGNALSPKGLLQSIAFALYYDDKFGEPDFMFAAHPKKSNETKSIRELQTLGPLANLLTMRHPDNSASIFHPYTRSEYADLAKLILTDKKFNGKRVLVCWSHDYIPQLARKLGVTQPIEKWEDTDFDSVYILKYDEQGVVTDFTILHHQYNVNFVGSWRDLYNRLM
ncbi:MAG: hypothetical protein SFW66_09260 [Gammaproteobacteria bacterium]|nr:hypothetical protein [Gammaproteobacteria bacterium]